MANFSLKLYLTTFQDLLIVRLFLFRSPLYATKREGERDTQKKS